MINMENMLHIKFTLTIFIRQSTRHNDIYYIFYLWLAMASAGIIFKGKCTSGTFKKIMDELYNREERDEFVGVQLYYFKKHYNSLIRRGM